MRRFVVISAFAFVIAILLSGCGGDTLGDSCKTDGDCSDGLTCLSPGCVGDKSCQYSCTKTSECESKAGKGSECNNDDPSGSCIGYCSAAD